MRKILLSSALFSLLSLSLHADFIRVEGAVGMWNADPSGSMSYKNNPEFNLIDTLGYDSETITYGWVLIKHPVPVLPNVRLEYSDLSYSGKSKIGYTWENDTVGVGASSTLDLKQYDAILYYNLLDNTLWATADVGMDIKYVKSSFDISDPSDNYTFSGSDTIVLPMLYGRLRAEIPMTGVGLESDLKWIGYGTTDAYDFRIKADYTFDSFVLEPMVEIGYRTYMMEIDGEDYDIEANADIDFSGLYFGVGFRY
jgi:outer membrane protein